MRGCTSGGLRARTGACERAAIELAGYPNHAARALRCAGEVQERTGDDAGALRTYERALALDPKVGIARRAAALRAQLGSG